MKSAVSAAAKRLLDLVVGAPLFALSVPVVGLLAPLIWLDSRGPVLFWQKRIGKGGKPFRVCKLRTMIPDAPELFRKRLGERLDQFVFQEEDDPRITRLGRWLRESSLDELPQLYNVLRGEMSLVGPRPEVPAVVERYDERQRGRLAVKPGITGLAQVSGRSDLPLGLTIEMDLAYVRRAGPAYDIGLLAWTIPAVLGGRGAR
jgi:lipopolysaccharide/colanic/teichoic acid biosynthesis glycosyltransferase